MPTLSLADTLMLASVFLVSAWLGRRGRPAARVVLWVSALLMSTAMFLPSVTLSAIVGPEVLAALTCIDRTFPWSASDLMHFGAFAWLALVVWALRPDLHGWRALGLLALLALGSEAMQGLVAGRSSRWDDVWVNLLGIATGALIGAVGRFGFGAAQRVFRPARQKPVGLSPDET